MAIEQSPALLVWEIFNPLTGRYLYPQQRCWFRFLNHVGQGMLDESWQKIDQFLINHYQAKLVEHKHPVKILFPDSDTLCAFTLTWLT
jgi:hypothetical protein